MITSIREKNDRNYCRERGDLDEAEKLYEKCVDLDPSDAQSVLSPTLASPYSFMRFLFSLSFRHLVELGRILYLQGKHEAAYEVLEKAIQRDNTDYVRHTKHRPVQLDIDLSIDPTNDYFSVVTTGLHEQSSLQRRTEWKTLFRRYTWVETCERPVSWTT